MGTESGDVGEVTVGAELGEVGGGGLGGAGAVEVVAGLGESVGFIVGAGSEEFGGAVGKVWEED